MGEERDYRERLAAAIVQLRALRGMTQEQLAEAVGRSEAAVSRWETAKVTPTAYDLVRLTEALRVPQGLLLNPPAVPTSPIAELLDEELAIADRAAEQALAEPLPDGAPAAPNGHRPPRPERPRGR